MTRFLRFPHDTCIADSIARTLEAESSSYVVHSFANGNHLIELSGFKMAQDVSILFAPTFNVGRDLVLLGLLVDCLRRSGTRYIRCFLTYLPYSRSNRLHTPNSSFGARVYVDLLCNMSIDEFILFDLHSEDVLGFFNKPTQTQSTFPLFVEYLKQNITVDFVIAPDGGRYNMCKKIADSINADLDIFVKYRFDHSGESYLKSTRKPHLRNRSVLIVDDELSTGVTMRNVVHELISEGVCSIHIAVIYPFCLNSSRSFFEEYGRSIDTFITTNLVLPEFRPPLSNMVVLDVSELFGV